MGESEDAMEYDLEKIFRHLLVYVSCWQEPFTKVKFVRCFYLDTPQNAQRNGMVSKSKHAPQIEIS